MSNKIKFLSKEDVEKCLDMKSTIEAMKSAFSELSNKNVKVPLRTSMTLDNKDSGALFMPVFSPSIKLVGLKSVMIHRENPEKELPMIHAMYQVFDAETGKPLAIMDGEYLTAMRTGAASGLATDLLAPKKSEIAVIFGAGVQSEKQVEAICSVRKLKEIHIADLDKERINNFIKRLENKFEAKLYPFKNDEILKEADIICTATSSIKPVFDNNYLKEKVHINGIGSYRPDMFEIPNDTIANSKLYVDSRDACLSEAGDILQPIKSGLINKDHIYAELGEVVNGSKELRTETDGITVFKSVGNAVQDIATAAVVLDNSEKLNIGIEINI